MENLKWKIGDVEIYQIVEIEASKIIQEVIKDMSVEAIQSIEWLHPNFADKNGNLKALVQCFLIKSGDKLILIDSCNGNHKQRTDVPEWGNLQTDFLKKLRSLGITEGDINIVACTHLHFDHVGWNTKLENDIWVPTFPNAKYIFVKDEYEYWSQKPEKEIHDDKQAFEDSVLPIVKAGQAELVDEHYEIDRYIKFIPTPGHTPHHVSVLIESQKQRAIISGDFLHHPCQIANPQWGSYADTLPEKATITRQKMLDDIADTDTLLIGSHFAFPVAGYVIRTEDGYKIEIHKHTT